MDFKEMNPLGIIGIVGAIIMIVGVFMTWFTVDGGMLGSQDWSGWKIFSDRKDIDDLKYLVVPLLTLIMGILAVALMVLPTVMNGSEQFKQINNILGIVAIVLSVVVVIMLILFYTQSIDYGTFGTKKLRDIVDFKAGFWLCLVGAIITAVGGIMPVLKNKGIINF